MEKSLVSRWWEPPAIDMLTAHAEHAISDVPYNAPKSLLSSRWHVCYASREFELLLVGPKYWDLSARKGGGGAADLAKHLALIDFSATVRLLQSYG